METVGLPLGGLDPPRRPLRHAVYDEEEKGEGETVRAADAACWGAVTADKEVAGREGGLAAPTSPQVDIAI